MHRAPTFRALGRPRYARRAVGGLLALCWAVGGVGCATESDDDDPDPRDPSDARPRFDSAPLQPVDVGADDANRDGTAPDVAWDAAADASVDAAVDARPDAAGDASHDAAADAQALPADASDAAPDPAHAPVAILFIGDGMGFGSIDAASLFAHGALGQLTMQDAARLPHQGRLRTASLSGITDSAAAATAFAGGVKVLNARPGLDRTGAPVESVFELARARGIGTGVVTTSTLTHATPAGFTAHHHNRSDGAAIAAQLAASPPEVMLGGGATRLAPHRDALAAAGFEVVEDAAGLAAVRPAPDTRLLGLFGASNLDYVLDRPADHPAPSLAEMTTAALEVLDARGAGFVLVVEGARIDMAGHANDLARQVHETLAFDDAVHAALDWVDARERPEDVLLMVTADHETGALRVDGPPPEPGALPLVSWDRFRHSNQRVPMFARGPGSARFGDAVHENTWVHAALRAHLTGDAVTPPAVVALPDGRFDDLRHRAVEQAVVSRFGEGRNQLDALHVDVVDGGRALAVGVAGLFETAENAVLLLIDVDPGAGTGSGRLAGALRDDFGRADAVVSQVNLDAPPVDGFGADFAVVSLRGSDPRLDELYDDGGLRGLRPPFGDAADFHWLRAALNFDAATLVGRSPQAPVEGRGFEVHLPLVELYPDGLPVGAAVTLAAVLVNSAGDFTSNQALPPFAPGTPNPGAARTALPGLVHFALDSDDDGLADGDAPPTLLPAD